MALPPLRIALSRQSLASWDRNLGLPLISAPLQMWRPLFGLAFAGDADMQITTTARPANK
jgi:hypothetical protein